MSEDLRFETLTGRFTLHYDRCDGCDAYHCVKACSLYGRDVLRIREGRPVLAVGEEEAKRLCIECLACEVECLLNGYGAIRIELPIPGLEEKREG
jgi:NAD-dependent dihydropyrimidine dehydrogenase PreA subunit